ncbi:MAG TPA: hypothetical protein VMA09_04040 [Candidatus Binataceae bacterium]|nr:hypothetical protein [Candidatus Binataceae bacterium]
MNQKMKEWILGFPCSRCTFMGDENLGTVLVLGQDDRGELQVIAFCYDCARVMMNQRRKPIAKRASAPASAPVGDRSRVIKLERRPAPSENNTKSARPPA